MVDGLVQRIYSAQQGPAQQHGRTESHLEQAKTRLGDGVVGGFLVCLQRDGGGESGGDAVAVPRHVAYLPRSQVELREQSGHQSGAEQQGKGK
ncbi:hypothetical protein D9M73_50010 [compost metagenome]